MSLLSNSKPIASRSATLLARKGSAKPAMRPQGFGGLGVMPAAQDDLGWNDMGTEPVPASHPPVSATTAARITRETRKAHGESTSECAFTLLLDQDRHLRLRLAGALRNTSPHSLVIQALDQFLQTLPEVDDLVRQLPARATR